MLGSSLFQLLPNSLTATLLAAVGILVGVETAPHSHAQHSTSTVISKPATSPQNSCGYDSSAALNAPADQLVSPEEPFLGSSNAEVTVIEFFDPNCPHCQHFHPVIKDIIEKYDDRVKFFMKPFPLWRYSLSQIEAMLLAQRDGKFFEMIDRQMQSGVTKGMSITELTQIAADLNLDTTAFKKGLQQHLLRGQVLQMRKAAVAAGVQSTPTVAIGDQVVGSQSRTRACLSQLLDQELASTE